MSKKIFAINSGSSSLKFQLLSMPEEVVITKGIFEKIGEIDAIFKLKSDNVEKKEILHIPSHEFAVEKLISELLENKIIQSLDEIDGVGHRVAHGGEIFKDSVKIDKKVEKYISDLSELAPSHNPVNLVGIGAFKNALPHVENVAVFDTSYHQTMTPEYYLYPLPVKYYEKYKIRKYGFHGTSHKFIASEIERILKNNKKDISHLNIISCHLGNGASICAIKDGKSINTSMGFTPLAGLMMGSRSGDIDPMILPFLMKEENLGPTDISKLLNQESGLLAISGISNDLRDLEAASSEGNERASLAIQLFVNRISQTISSYISDLGGIDVLVFTAGIGENSSLIREKVVERLACFDLLIDSNANENGALFIHSNLSKAIIAIVPTNEEIMIARDTMRLLGLY